MTLSSKCTIRAAVVLISVISGAAALSSIVTRNPNGTGQLDSRNEVRDRDKRSLMFPYNSALGIIVAIAVPLGIPGRNIFMSYNFEGNYNSPGQSNIFTEGFFNYIRGVAPPLFTPVLSINRALQGDPEIEESTNDPSSSVNNEETTEKLQTQGRSERELAKSFPKRLPIFTRKKAYRAIEEHLKKNGFNGKKCLLRAICEAAEIPMLENNGVMGDLVHIILSPSTSENENLPPEFYKAEKLGLGGNCRKYRKHCEESILDMFSFMM